MSQLVPGSLQAIEKSRNLPSGQKDASTDCRMRIEVGDKIKAKLVRTMSDHHSICVDPAEQFIADF